MKPSTLLGCFLLCAVPVSSQYVIDTIPDIDYIANITLFNEKLLVNGTDDGDSGSFCIIENMVKTKVLNGTGNNNGPRAFAFHGGKIFYPFNDMSSGQSGKDFCGLWYTDTNGVNAEKVDEGRIGDLCKTYHGAAYRKYTDSTGYELWLNDRNNGPELFLDINPGSGSSYPFGFVSMWHNLFFFANVPGRGVELCNISELSEDTVSVLELCPGPRGCIPTFPRVIGEIMVNVPSPTYQPVLHNNDIYFLADDSTHGYELWCYNFVKEKAVITKDITPGTGSSFDKQDTVNKLPFIIFMDKFYFVANHPDYGKELWCTNGTDTGTVMIKDINPGPGSSGITGFAVDEDYIYFAADDGVHGSEIWRTDGTDTGTVLYSDIQPQTYASTGSNPRNLTVHYDGKLYFTTECLIEDSLCVDGNCVSYDSTAKAIYRVDDFKGITEKIVDLPPDELIAEDHMFVPSIHGLFFRGVSPYSHKLCRLQIFDQPPCFLTTFVDTTAKIGQNFIKEFRFTDPDGQKIKCSASSTIFFLDVDEEQNSGSLSGIPKLHGDFPVEITLKSSPSPAVTKGFKIYVPQHLFFITSPETNAEVNTQYLYEFEVEDTSGAQVNQLFYVMKPDWMEFERLTERTGRVYGTPTESGVYYVQLGTTSITTTHSIMQCFDVNVKNRDTLSFTSVPETTSTVGMDYNYSIKVTGSNGGQVTINPSILPSWLTYSSDNMSISGTPSVEGDYGVELIATTPGFPSGVTQRFTIHVAPDVTRDLVVYSYEESVNIPGQSNPRLYIVNNGLKDISDFIVEYYFLTENGKIPQIEKYYTGDCNVSVKQILGSFYKIVYDYTGKTIKAGQILPGSGGSVVGLHYNDFSIWNKTDDYSNNLLSSFTINNKICIYQNGTLIFGTPPAFLAPPVANAGNSITVVDTGAAGETVQLDGTGSYDPDGTIVNYQWHIDDGRNLTGSNIEINFAQGMHTVNLKVIDDDGNEANDTIMVNILNQSESIIFKMSPNPVPKDVPVILEYTVPAALNGARISYTLKRQWDVVNGVLNGNQGTFSFKFWEWNKSFFGGSGPWPITLNVNGTVVEVKQISFPY